MTVWGMEGIQAAWPCSYAQSVQGIDIALAEGPVRLC